MKRMLSLSVAFHILLFSGLIFPSFIWSKRPAAPVIHRVGLVSLPQAPARQPEIVPARKPRPKQVEKKPVQQRPKPEAKKAKPVVKRPKPAAKQPKAVTQAPPSPEKVQKPAVKEDPQKVEAAQEEPSQ